MVDLVTGQIIDLPLAVALDSSAYIPLQSPGGPAQRIQIPYLFRISGLPAFRTRADLLDFKPDAAQMFVYVLAYDASSLMCPALYMRVAAQPAHGLKAQDALGGWWEIAEDVVNLLAAGWEPGANAKAAFERIDGACATRKRKALVPRYDVPLKDCNIYNPMDIEFASGAVAVPLDNDSSATATNIGFNVRGHDFSITGFRGRGTAGTVNGTPPPLYAWLSTVRPADINNEGPRLRGLKISDWEAFGGRHGIILTSVEDFRVEGIKNSWQYDWGTIITGNSHAGTVYDSSGHYIGLTEAFRLGTSGPVAGVLEDIILDRLRAEHCGWLGGAGAQDNFDLFKAAGRRIIVRDCRSINGAAGFAENKNEDGGVFSFNGDADSVFEGNHSTQYYAATKHLALRNDPNQVGRALVSKDRVRRVRASNNVFETIPFTAHRALPIGAIATLVGSRVVTIAAPNHTLSNGDQVMLRTNGTALGGIPAHELMMMREVRVPDANNFTMLVETAATATTASAAVATAYELGSVPMLVPNCITTTAGSANIDITLPFPHGLTTADGFEISGADATGGFAASVLNGRFNVRQVIDANTIRCNSGAVATATATGGGLQSAILFRKGVQSNVGIWLNSVDDVLVTGNIHKGGGVSILMDANTSGQSEPLLRPRISNEIVQGCQTFIRFTRGEVVDPKITNCHDVETYGPVIDTGSTHVRVVGGEISHITSRTRNGFAEGVGTFFNGRSLQGTRFNDIDHIGNGCGFHIQINAGAGLASAGVVIEKSSIKVDNSAETGVNVPNRQALRLSETSASFRVQDNKLFSGNGLISTLLENGATRIGRRNIVEETSVAGVPARAGVDGDEVWLLGAAVTAANSHYERVSGAWVVRAG